MGTRTRTHTRLCVKGWPLFYSQHCRTLKTQEYIMLLWRMHTAYCIVYALCSGRTNPFRQNDISKSTQKKMNLYKKIPHQTTRIKLRQTSNRKRLCMSVVDRHYVRHSQLLHSLHFIVLWKRHTRLLSLYWSFFFPEC